MTDSLPPRDPNQPLPGEVPPGRRELFIKAGVLVVTFGVGVMTGFGLTPENSEDTKQYISKLETELSQTKRVVADYERGQAYNATAQQSPTGGHLKAADRKRHERESRRYAKMLRQEKAQSAADLLQWFVTRWNGMLDQPSTNDRTGRRAELLSLLIGGMADNLHPNDYVPWQAEFLNATWLGDLHFDLDGDGFPGKRNIDNPRDGFVDTSVCHIAMALNQASRDARVLVMPDMRCDRPEAKMSIFLQGKTLDDALTDFVAGLKREGFVAVERVEKSVRLILIGKGSRGYVAEE